MEKHADDAPVMFSYSSSRNVTFRGTDESGFTWGEWREMSKEQQDEAIQDYANELIEVYVEGDEY